MIKINNLIALSIRLNNPLIFGLKTPKKIRSFQSRISHYNHQLDQYDRKFLIRPPNLSTKNQITFPIKIAMRVRHKWNPKKRIQEFVDNTEKIKWNRLTPNQILLGFQKLEYLKYDQMMEGLKYLSQVQGQQNHNWNTHIWVSKALERVNTQFNYIKRTDYLQMYNLMKKLKYQNKDFWKKIYDKIEDMIYDLYPSEFERFFLKYYKISDQYFSPEMKDKFLTLLEGRLRSFSPSGIIKVYQIYQEQNRIDDYWKYNVFVPLFKSQQYTYKPIELYKIFRFMLILNHQKDDRLYNSLYKRLISYKKFTLEEIDMLEQVIGEIKDLFISHRVDSYIKHLSVMRQETIKAAKSEKKQIPLHELVRRDIQFLLNKRKLQEQNAKITQTTA